ncbi:hypothetical protein FLP41_12330 [Paracoccus marcusii]|uniref:CAP domain-containing protein n=1 Tax=Paracoccus marcusii TaxID=59779 RepID=UPI002ED2BC9F|nr:hypothetical protein FLP41_12330 [Paracoccus marcusii]
MQANDLLARAAARHACDMAQRGRMTHAGSRSSGPSQRVKALGYAPTVTAENIAAGPSAWIGFWRNGTPLRAMSRTS